MSKCIKIILPIVFLSVLQFACNQDSKPTDDTHVKTTSEAKLGLKEIDSSKREQEDKVILFFGNSITAGYGVELSESFPAVLQRRMDSLDLSYEVRNSGISGETTTDGVNRLDFVLGMLKKDPDIFVLELGANDGLRGLDLSQTRENLRQIIRSISERYPEVRIVLCGMEVPPNLGEAYTNEFRNIFSDLAEQPKVHLVPFLLDGVAGNPELNLPDGIHPTPEGHKIVAENVWEVLQSLISDEEEQNRV